MMNRIWKYITAALSGLALFFYALLQRSKRKRSDEARERSEKARKTEKAIQDSVQKARQEATENEKKVREDSSNRRAGLNNDRLRDK